MRTSRLLVLLLAVALAACTTSPESSPGDGGDGDAPDGLDGADSPLTDADPEAWPADDAASDDDDDDPEDPTPAPEEIGMSPGDADPGTPGVMTGLRARVAWNDGFVHTPPQEITLTAPVAGMPSEPDGGLPPMSALTPEQAARMAEVEALMRAQLAPAFEAMQGVAP